MHKKIRWAFAAVLVSLAINASADWSTLPSGDYRMDKSHAYITFTFDHYGYSIPLVGFNSFNADLNLDTENPANSSVIVTIDAASVDSRVDSLDERFKGDTFFDTKNFPEIIFRSTEFIRTGEDTYDVVGELTIRNITNTVTLATTIRQAGIHPRRNIPAIGISGEATVNRSAWNMTFDSPGVPDEVTILITAEFAQPTTD
jgi:polyisoprenoid-binding protein YceI